MSSESLKVMHRRFLEGIREKRVALQEELRTLGAVERYHSQELERNEGAATAEDNSTSGGASTRNLAKRLRGAKKKDAARIVLEQLGRPAKIGEMIDVLWENKYATNMERRVLHNTLYTGMTRCSDIFEKLEDGLWTLEIEGDANGDETDSGEE